MDDRSPQGFSRNWTPEQIALVRERYPYCHSREDKEVLAARAGIGSVASLYNLANRLKITRPHCGGVGADARVGDHYLDTRDPYPVEFGPERDGFIRRNFGALALDRIASHIDRSESACLVRARELDLRSLCKYWEAHRVCAWLGDSASALSAVGVAFHVLEAPDGDPTLVLVSSSSLIRVVAPDADGWVARGADAHFVAEVSAMCDPGASWEPSRWISHEHVCLNPWSGVSYGLFDDGSDTKMYGRDLHVDDLSIPVPVAELDELVATLRLP